ncbi:N-formylglutamate amidohydrolase [Planctomicrobium sp. SH527]|uniref:N-formylglutamate amidohydrolase n=1 Tax=Planctomicrobium sp. SH527 TaxID=3448123 RepID=UPI003F5C26BB
MLVLTCEHGGNLIPKEYRHWFKDARNVLQTHRGHDPGALVLARRLSRAFEAPLFCETRSRLLIELNRSLDHPRLFSEFSRQLPAETREQLIDTIYRPYRESVINELKGQVAAEPTVHVSVHSFTPVMNGKVRRTQIGLLFDPARSFETAVCTQWKRELKRLAPELKVHFNLPYRGTSDGFTTSLRELFPDQSYAGIELEVNQQYPLGEASDWKRIQSLIEKSLAAVLNQLS